MKTAYLLLTALLFLLGLAARPDSAKAETVYIACSAATYTAGTLSSSSPARVRDFFAARDADNGVTLNTCTFNGGTSYTVLAPPQKTGSVCVYRTLDVTAKMLADKNYGVREAIADIAREAYTGMTLADGACPQPLQYGYTSIPGVTPAIFEDVARAWQAAQASPQSLDAMLAPAPKGIDFKSFRDRMARFLAAKDEVQIQSLIRDGNGRILMELRQPGGGGMPPGNPQWELTVLFMPDGIKIGKVARYYPPGISDIVVDVDKDAKP